MTEETRAKNFQGRPTGDEVALLLRTFPRTPGTDIPYAALEEVLGLTRQDPHFWSVLGAWRGWLEREQNLETSAIPGKGIRILLAVERLGKGERGFRLAVRGIGRSQRRLSATPDEDLTPHERLRKAHAQRVIGTLLMEARRARRRITPPRPVQEQPGLPLAC
jgi:hypothetical protein